MLETSDRAFASSSAFAPSPSYTPPRRGTPAYAAAVRTQIARLAAAHAAEVAAQPPAPVPPVSTVLIAVACPQVRTVVRRALAGLPWVRIDEADPAQPAPASPWHEKPSLVLTDEFTGGGATWAAAVGYDRTVYIAGAIPRAGVLPPSLAAVLALPLKADRVARAVLSLLGPDGQVSQSQRARL